MSAGLDELLDQAKRLSETDRRRLIDELAATLPEENDVDDEAFLAELERRRNEGVTQGVDWETLKKSL